MDAADLLLSAIAGAMIVISGGLYALFLALARLRRSKRLGFAAAGSYFALVIFVFVLVQSLELDRAWYLVIAVMLGGYLIAPTAIWHLTHATHGGTMDEP